MSVLKKLGAKLTASQARALYRDADADGDGKVTLSEFSKVIFNILFLFRSGTFCVPSATVPDSWPRTWIVGACV